MAAAYFRDKVNGKWPSSNLDMLHHIAAITAGLTGPWIIGADWNCTPEELMATGWLKLVGGTIAAPKAPTCNGSVYDFFVVANSLGHAVFGTHTIGDAQCSPHSPSRLLLRAKPRPVQVQVIRSPGRFDACLPFGPTNKPSEAEDNDSLATYNLPTEQLFARTLSRIENELNDIKGITAEEASKHPSRTEGPLYAWKTLCGKTSTDACKSTCISRCWRRTALWLSKAAKAKTPEARKAEGWKIRFYVHDFPPYPTLPIFREIVAFNTWRTYLTHDVLANPVWTKCFADHAVNFAERAEDQAHHAANARFLDWLNEGPAAGLGKQVSSVAILAQAILAQVLNCFGSNLFWLITSLWTLGAFTLPFLGFVACDLGSLLHFRFLAVVFHLFKFYFECVCVLCPCEFPSPLSNGQWRERKSTHQGPWPLGV